MSYNARMLACGLSPSGELDNFFKIFPGYFCLLDIADIVVVVV